MPEKATLARAERARRSGKSAGTQAGEFVREEIHHIRAGEHGAKSAKQAIAIGLSKARRAGVKLKARKGHPEDKPKRTTSRPDPERSAAASKALRKKPHRAASHLALSRQARKAARTRAKKR